MNNASSLLGFACEASRGAECRQEATHPMLTPGLPRFADGGAEPGMELALQRQLRVRQPPCHSAEHTSSLQGGGQSVMKPLNAGGVERELSASLLH